jgi:hypothetical protein
MPENRIWLRDRSGKSSGMRLQFAAHDKFKKLRQTGESALQRPAAAVRGSRQCRNCNSITEPEPVSTDLDIFR